MKNGEDKASLRACARKLQTEHESVSLRAPLGAQTGTAFGEDGASKIAPIGRKPSKHFRLVLWWLLYRVHPQTDITRDHEREACAHARMKTTAYRCEKALFPDHWQRLLAKRGRRCEWILRWRWIAHGWTPRPDFTVDDATRIRAWERRLAGDYFERLEDATEPVECFARTAVNAHHSETPQRAPAPACAKHWQRSGAGRLARPDQ